MKQKKNEEAARLIEQKLNASIMEVYLLLNSLATVAVWRETGSGPGRSQATAGR